MIFCVACGIANRDGSKFCNDCGSAMGGERVVCLSCETPNPPANRFCGTCGALLPTTAAPTRQDGQVLVAEPPTISEVDDELPSLEADVPPFFAPAAHVPAVPPVERILPGWLDSLDSPPTDFQAAEAAAKPPQLPVLPGWLALHESPKAVAETSLLVSPPEPQAPELPAWLWLEELAAPAPALPDWLASAEAAVPPAPSLVSLPDWLTWPEPPPLPAVPATRTGAALPDWLTLPESPPSPLSQSGSVNGDEAQPANVVQAEASSPEDEGMPKPGLEALAGQPWIADDVRDLSEPYGPLFVLSQASLPEWLTMAEPAPSTLAPATVSQAVLPAWISLPDRLLPDWLDATEPDVAPFRNPPSLPDWLSLPEAPTPALPGWLFAEETSEPAAELGRLPMEAMSDGVTASAVPVPGAIEEAAADAKASPAPVPSISTPVEHPAVMPDARVAKELEPDVHTLPSIIMARPLQSPQPPVRTPSRPAQIPDYASIFAAVLQPSTEPLATPALLSIRRHRLISALLLLVLSVALIVPLGANSEPRGPTKEVFKTIQALAPSANVLVSFDWTAGDNDEVAPIAEALVGHLAKRKVRILAVSLVPEGGKLAQRTIDKVVLAGSKDYVYGERVVNLGYKPGDQAAVQAISEAGKRSFNYEVDYFGTPTKDLPLFREFKAITSTDLIVEITGDPRLAEKWITQLTPRYPGIQMVAGINNLSLPWVLPFSSGQPRQLKGIVTGVRGAAEYELERVGLDSGPDGVLSKKKIASWGALDAQSYGAVFLALVIVFGNIAHLRASLKRSK